MPPPDVTMDRNRNGRRVALGIVFTWFLVGGLGHFLATEFFVQIVPPELPLRKEAVWISGFFELVGAAGLLHPLLRRAAGYGLMVLTVAVTPANVYMWTHADLFPHIPAVLLLLRLPLQLALLAGIWYATAEMRRTSSPRFK